MNPHQQELVEVLRRIAERGKALAEARGEVAYLDVFVHLLDELKRLKESIE